MGKTAFIFPGQGAQKTGMGKDFYDHSPEARGVFEEADRILGFSVEELCFEKNERLDITEYTQAAMVTVSLAMMKEIEKRGFRPHMTSGLSLGEYCALTVSGIMKAEDTIRVVRQRGILMQEAVPAGLGGMAAILGLDGESVRKVTDDMEGVQIANYNCPGQIVISGKKEAVEEACGKLKSAGAKRTVILNVSGPFHSSMLEEAGKKLGEVLCSAELSKPRIPYITNVTAEPVLEEGKVKALLQAQVSSSVKWQQCVERMIAEGADRFVEIGPGKTLTGFVRKTASGVKVYNVENWEDLEGLGDFCSAE